MGEHILVVGSGSPIATSSISAFLARGDRVSTISRTSAPEESDIQQPQTGALRHFPCDLENIKCIRNLLTKISSNSLEIDRICFFQRYRGESLEPWGSEFSISLLATAEIIEWFAEVSSTKSERSVVIVTSPADSHIAGEQPASYHAVKAGLSQLIRYYAVKFGKRGIRVNGVKPAIVIKPRSEDYYAKNPRLTGLFNRITPLGRMGRPVDIANVILFLSSEGASFITGQIISVDGGLSLHESASLANIAAGDF